MPKQKKEVVEISKKKVWSGAAEEGNKRWLVWTRLAFGKRIKRYCESREDAEKVRDELREEYRGHGVAASELSSLQRADAARALSKLDRRINLEGSADFWLLHHPLIEAPRLEEAAKKFLEDRRRWVGARRIRDLECRLRKLYTDFPTSRVSEISENQAREWLRKKHKNIAPGRKGSSLLTPWAKNTYVLNFKQFFAWCMDQRWCAVNPFAAIKNEPVKRREAPEIYTPEEAQKLIKAAIAHPDVGLLAYYTLGLFAGVRVSELGRVHWSMIDLPAKELRLVGKLTKTYHPRTLQLSDTVVEKLKLVENKAGPIIAVSPKRRRARLHKLAEVHFRNNGLRHSFASYHAKIHKNATWLQEIMGQKTANVLFDHYIAATKPEDAKAYFEI